AAVREGAAELGFVEGTLDDPALASTTVAEDQLMLLVAPGHPWARRSEMSLDELAEGSWVLREPGSGTRSAFEETLAQRGFAPTRLTVMLELPSNEAVRAAVEADGGATVLSASVAAASLRAETLCHVPFDLPKRAFRMLRHKERYRSRAADALLDLIKAAPTKTT
ncbi:LysR substrate-binding domain-containing protein, partial [Methylobacterium sp. V23]|uniref:LysR substrate-binding domain-containing protein n=1 Tax=Methylobacterium sp. V23 TaxID=2044878 RepID=UPI000D48A9C3